jgi:hypothetical protein
VGLLYLLYAVAFYQPLILYNEVRVLDWTVEKMYRQCGNRECLKTDLFLV